MPAYLADRGTDMCKMVAAKDQHAKVRLLRQKYLDTVCCARRRGVVLAESKCLEGLKDWGEGAGFGGGEVRLRK